MNFYPSENASESVSLPAKPLSAVSGNLFKCLHCPAHPAFTSSQSFKE